MENPFFSALGNSSCIDAAELSKGAKDTLTPFMHYLENSIKALEGKQVSCHWKPLAYESYQLIPQQKIYQITPTSVVKIKDNNIGWYEITEEVDGTSLDDDFMPDPDDTITVGKGRERQSFDITANDFVQSGGKYKLFLPELAEIKAITWSGYQLALQPLSLDLSTLNSVKVDGCLYSATAKNNTVTISGLITPTSKLTVDDIERNFIIMSACALTQLEKLNPIQSGNSWLVFNRKKPIINNATITDITQDSLSKLSASHFSHDDKPLVEQQWKISYKKISGFSLQAQLSDQQAISDIVCSEYPQLELTINKEKIKEHWIQLIEPENSDDSGKSVLDYFFEDYVNIHHGEKNKNSNRDPGYKVIKSKPEERQLLLATNADKHKSVYPQIADKSTLRVQVDTSQLKKQRDAINNLILRPTAGQATLIKLLQNRDNVQWPLLTLYAKPIDWKVLSDPNFDGCKEQREFVTKALGSSDFTILDGPPGTGKTTTILELIVQLVRQGKRILLSASTHAAINNVLERVEENNLLDEIFPLRIGDESKATNVEHFQYDNQLISINKELSDNISDQILVDSSNLVCGTTIGILKLFRERAVSLDNGTAPFDVMIIDECSKTTFQEFLVPAQYAKSFVLVGDVKQLSPFTDREQIVCNLQQLMLKPGRGHEKSSNYQAPKLLSPDIQQACFLLEELRGDRNDLYNNQLIVPVSLGVLQALGNEIKARSHSCEQLNNLLLIGERPNESLNIYGPAQILKNPIALYQHNICFIASTALSTLEHCLPVDAIMLSDDWQSNRHAFIHNTNYKNKQSVNFRKEHKKTSTEINQAYLSRFQETNWAEELCWRLERVYWLRLSKNKNADRYEKDINRLLPAAINVLGRVHGLKNIAFPSILEALSGDGLVKRKVDSATTLNQGFHRTEKLQRHTTLTYQHRMHPDISAYPREQFYQNRSLFDGNQVSNARQWDYPRFAKHNVWIDVTGSVFKNANRNEVNRIIDEIERFCKWAQGKVKNRKNEPYDMAILTFYKGQEKALREALQQLTGNKSSYAKFDYLGIQIKLATVDYFQGQEADFVMLSMVNTTRDGFLDAPNRLNVAITRARYQLAIVGQLSYFSRSRSPELKQLTKTCLTIR
ncbi:DNA helicase [Psychromonas sp. CNPT3]|uniref:AAA domain-containing protein n=1 Tax=Psychromonas sp. CNPT3 TaxID=314282 RepID=UPI00006E4254|nr:AAA domain-containing protein [Psychromonas sp. CNPT3]AGH81080.1 DNA helicase [Psychromonas sp. CNPT3]